jgi:hypothetical protein
MRLLILSIIALSLNAGIDNTSPKSAFKTVEGGETPTSQAKTCTGSDSEDGDSPVKPEACTDIVVHDLPNYQRYNGDDLSFLSETELEALGQLDNATINISGPTTEPMLDGVKWAVFTSLDDSEIGELADRGPGLAIEIAITEKLRTILGAITNE